jgi:hypothetical protein
MISKFIPASIKLLILMIGYFPSIQMVSAQSTHLAFITNLNTKEESILETGATYFYELKKDGKVLSGKLLKVTADSVNFDGNNFALHQLTGISDRKFKRLNGLHKTSRVAGLVGGVTFLTGILMSISAEDWQPPENSVFAKSSFIALPLLIPSVLFLQLHKGPKFDLSSKHLLETKPLP